MIHPKGTALYVTLRWSSTQIQPVGRLAMAGRKILFEFDQEFISSGIQLSPVKMKVRPGVFEGPPQLGGLHGPFHDSLPDAWGRLLIDRQAARRGFRAAELTLLDRLACVGTRGMGALVYHPESALPYVTGELDLDSLAADSHRVLQGEAAEVLEELVVVGGSPGGARPKALIGYDAASERVVHGLPTLEAGFLPTLVKFRAPTDPEDMGAIEAAYSNMARAAGLRVQPSWLLPARTGPGYFATQRFDREESTDGENRLHSHTLAGLLETDFRQFGLDYDALLRVTRLLTRDEREVSMAFRLMVFNVLAHNRDDHGKQFSFLMNRAGQWRLAPAYDLTFSEGPGGEHSTTIAGEGKVPGREHFTALADRLGIGQAATIEDQVRAAVRSWSELAADSGVGNASLRRIAARLEL